MPQTAEHILRQEYLLARAKILELAATLDRIERAEGNVDDDPQMQLLRRGFQIRKGDGERCTPARARSEWPGGEPLRRRNPVVQPVLLEANRDKVDVMAKALLEWETLDADQVNDIMAGSAPRAPKYASERKHTPGSGAGPVVPVVA